ncbi:hypothetical protein ACFOLK_13940 [Marinococcus halophilus]|uniref:Uncharacterized protein n=1 Tax=Marinococcus halophilus TaxID=1371 RepID=A0A510Y7W7_MARHA|nr:hypothetical protein [Marinococcus halophilus]GEK59480.1 hypothetical protein MHA01_23850 [Marinococcus halophilus]
MTPEEKEKIVQHVSEEIYKAHPWLWDRFKERGREKTEEDNHHHLKHLETSYALSDRSFFLDYTAWLESVLNERGVSTAIIIDNYKRLRAIFPLYAAKEERLFFTECLTEGIEQLEENIQK